MDSQKPVIILIFSGKRKSGKDYVTDLLRHRLGTERCSILRLSAPLKEQYAKDNNLDFNELLEATEYKEKYRLDMIKWGNEKREQDRGYFCRLICTGPGSNVPVWIISDARRRSDIEWFTENYPGIVVTVRVQTDEEIRKERGWMFTEGVDDAESECGLDSGVTFDHVITNNGHNDELEADLLNLQELVNLRTMSQ